MRLSSVSKEKRKRIIHDYLHSLATDLSMGEILEKLAEEYQLTVSCVRKIIDIPVSISDSELERRIEENKENPS